MQPMHGRWSCVCYYYITLVIFLQQLRYALASSSSSSAFNLPEREGDSSGSAVSENGKFFQYTTRQDIQAPVWRVVRENTTLAAPGYWFVAPYEEKTQEEPGPGYIGPHIYDGDGELIWSGTPMFRHWNVFDFTVSDVDGEPHLSMLDWHGQRGIVLNSSYEVWKTAPMLAAGDTFQNMHAFAVLDDGKSALPLTVRHSDTSIAKSMADVGYNGSCSVGFQGFRELDLRANNTPILFEWEPKDHISLNESTYIKFNGEDYDGTAKTMCKRGWDAMHVNSIDKFPDGDYLLSARHTDTLYKISAVDGSVVWRLGGPISDFEFLGNANFARQHHGQVLEQNSTHCILSLFDNAIGEGFQDALRRFSRGLILSLDLAQMTASTVAQYGHPKGHLSPGRGSCHILPNGNAFVNWAENSRLSEHAPTGPAFFEAFLPAEIDTYRAFKFPWIGRPAHPPDVHAEVIWMDKGVVQTNVSMSWNGATEVDRWVVRGIDDEGTAVQIATVPRAGFETRVHHKGFVTSVYAEALDRHGVVLGTSEGGGRAWPERITPRLKSQIEEEEEEEEEEEPGSSPLKIVVLVVVILAIGTLSAAGFLFWLRRSRRRAEAGEAEDKGEYRMVEQGEGDE